MPIYLTFHEGGALLEDAPSDSCLEVTLPERELAVLSKLLGLESYEVSRSIGALAAFCISEGHRQSRRVCQPNS